MLSREASLSRYANCMGRRGKYQLPAVALMHLAISTIWQEGGRTDSCARGAVIYELKATCLDDVRSPVARPEPSPSPTPLERDAGNASAKRRQATTSVKRYLHSLWCDVAYVRAEEWHRFAPNSAPGNVDFVHPSGCRCAPTVVLTVLGAMAIYLVPTVEA
jgi:hypothetical protein